MFNEKDVKRDHQRPVQVQLSKDDKLPSSLSAREMAMILRFRAASEATQAQVRSLLSVVSAWLTLVMLDALNYLTLPIEP